MKILNYLKVKAQPRRTQQRFRRRSYAKVQMMYMFLSIDNNNHVFTFLLSIIYFYNCTVFTFACWQGPFNLFIFCNVFFIYKESKLQLSCDNEI